MNSVMKVMFGLVILIRFGLMSSLVLVCFSVYDSWCSVWLLSCDLMMMMVLMVLLMIIWGMFGRMLSSGVCRYFLIFGFGCGM